MLRTLGADGISINNEFVKNVILLRASRFKGTSLADSLTVRSRWRRLILKVKAQKIKHIFGRVHLLLYSLFINLWCLNMKTEWRLILVLPSVLSLQEGNWWQQTVVFQFLCYSDQVLPILWILSKCPPDTFFWKKKREENPISALRRNVMCLHVCVHST